MTRHITSALALALAVSLPAALEAKGNKPAHAQKGKPAAHATAAGNCPPGLAKKSPACVPPGQAKKSDGVDELRFNRGDIYDGDYPILRDYARYDLPRLDPGERYYRVGDNVIAVDEDTRLVLDIIGIASRLSN